MATIHYTLVPASGALPAPILTIAEPGGTPPPPADTTPPSAPGTPTAGTITSTTVGLSWAASTDNVAVTGYRVYRTTGGGSPTLVASPVGNSATISGLTPDTTYNFTVKAIDAAGNLSAASGALEVTTEEAGVGVGGTVATATGEEAGLATFGQALPEGTAFGSLSLPGVTTQQCDVKTTWSDDSIRFAIITADVEDVGPLDMEQGEAASGSVTPVNPTAEVRLTIGGTLYTAALPSTPSSDVWLSGPVVDSRRYRVAPMTSGGTPTPHVQLRVIYDVWTYANGARKVDVCVENSLNQDEGITYTYDLDVVIGGSSVFSKTAVVHHYLRRWRKVFVVGSLTEGIVTSDVEQMILAGAIPRYLDDPSTHTYSATGVKFEILREGGNSDNMGAPGADHNIGPLPDPTAYWLSTRDPVVRDYILKTADHAGALPYHLREPEGGTYSGIGDDRFVSIVQRPIFGTMGNWRPPGQYMLGSPDGGSPYYTQSHCPSTVFVPYLLTGDRYYADEMAFTANWHLISHPGWAPTDTARMDTGLIVAGIVAREGAWSLRNIVDAAAYLPDDHPHRPLFESSAAVNMAYYDTWFHGTPGNPGVPISRMVMPPGVPPHMPGQVGYDNETALIAHIQPWSMWFVVWVIHHANRQGFPGGEDYQAALIQFQLDMMTPALTGYPVDYSSPGFLYIGDKGELNTTTQEYHIIPDVSLAACFNRTYNVHGDAATNFNGNYGVYTWVVLRIAELHGHDVATKLAQAVTLNGVYLPDRPGWYFDVIDDLGSGLEMAAARDVRLAQSPAVMPKFSEETLEMMRRARAAYWAQAMAAENAEDDITYER